MYINRLEGEKFIRHLILLLESPEIRVVEKLGRILGRNCRFIEQIFMNKSYSESQISEKLI